MRKRFVKVQMKGWFCCFQYLNHIFKMIADVQLIKITFRQQASQQNDLSGT